MPSGTVSPNVGTALRTVFAATLAAPAATIDTGANGIPANRGELLIWAFLRTTEAGAISNALLTFNADAGANYDTEGVTGNNVTAASSAIFGANNILCIVHGAGGSASYPALLRFSIPFYDSTTFFKMGEFNGGANDGTAANNWNVQKSFTWRSTAAITQLTLTTTAGNFVVGSSLLILSTA